MNVRQPFALLLAMCCLLLGSGPVTAAAPNQLRNGSVTPGAGTTQTTFVFSVDYSSERDFAATSVVAVVAGRSIRLSLASGSATAGTYRGSAGLPAGRWPVSFEAQATQGPIATLVGPTVTVTAPAATPKPVPGTPKPVPVTPAPTPRLVVATPVATSRPPAAATAAPSRAATPTPAAATDDPSGSATPSASSRSAEPASSAGSPDPRPSADTASPRPDESSVPAAAVPGSLSAPPAGGETDGPPPWLVIVGSAATGVVLFVVWRRRPRNAEEAVRVAQPEADATPISLAARARQRQAAAAGHTEDPILAAMGVGVGSPHAPRLDAPLSRRVHSGPGERPEPAKSRRRAG